jgi:hypothetical protein
MKAYEELARLKVNEAIQRGLEAQRLRREAVAVVSPDLTAWTASPMGSGAQAPKVVWGRRGRVRRVLEADWARLATIWLVARAWFGER